ncbi:MAG: hypothetical protein NZ824_03490 [Candidatus Thioglobus sp.]|nr:hypothetical protein [Candidatus Thioglobus sp.]
MAHFAKIGLGYEVLRVIVVDNENILDAEGNESEQVGIDYITKITGYPFWKQSSYNDNFRGKHASRGFLYNPELDCFHEKEPPYESWSFSEETLRYEAPTPKPDDGKEYEWVELTQKWVEILF